MNHNTNKYINAVRKKIKGQGGFTLSELTVYVAIFAVIVVILVATIVQLAQLKNRANSISIIATESSNFFEELIFDIRHCDSFVVVDEETLQVIDGESTKEYSLSSEIIYMTNATDTYEITTNQVRVENLKFADWTSVNSSNLVHVEISLRRGAISENFQTSIHQR